MDDLFRIGARVHLDGMLYPVAACTGGKVTLLKNGQPWTISADELAKLADGVLYNI